MFIVDISGSVAAFQYSNTPTTNVVARHAAKRKHVTRALLAHAGVAIAQGAVFKQDELELALEYAHTLNSPVVIKPTNGRKGRHVAVGMTPGPQFRQAFLDAISAGQQVLIEQQFTNANEARFLVVGDACVAVFGKLPAMVIGDGYRTIRELIDAKNCERAKNPHLRKRLIKLTTDRIDLLTRHGLTPDDVLPLGQKIVLDLKANISGGGDSFDATDDVHPSYKEVAVTAAAAVVGLDPAGVDMLAHDFGKPAKSGNYIVCEVNSQTALGAHHFPAQGKPRNVARFIAEHVSRERSEEVRKKRKDEMPLPQQSDTLPRTEDVKLGEFYDRNAELIAREWMRRGVDICWLTKEFFLTKPHGILLGYWGTASSLASSTGVTVTSRKDFVRQLVTRAGLSVARGRIYSKAKSFRALSKASAFARSLGCTTVKPIDGASAGGLTLAVQDPTDFERAWDNALTNTQLGVVVEEYVKGIPARFLVVGDRCVAVKQRGSDGRDITDFVHTSFKEIAAKAMRAVSGLDMACVDIIAQKFEVEARPGNYVIVDVDSTPSIWEYHFPITGIPRNIAGAIVEYHLAHVRAARSFRVRQLLPTRLREKFFVTQPMRALEPSVCQARHH
jgi:D-alanine-D-alanine ligase-like ATP-grasp enzyme